MNAPTSKSQRGVALIVVLILLLIATLLGLATMRGTLLEERMSGNLYDRSLSFQAAERALREAQALISSGATNLGQDCTSVVTACPIPDAYTGQIDTSACPTCWTNSTALVSGDLTAGVPQYYIQRMHETTTNQQLGLGNDALQTNEGAPGGTTVVANYRIFARSQDPTTAPDRAIVMLQANVARK